MALETATIVGSAMCRGSFVTLAEYKVFLAQATLDDDTQAQAALNAASDEIRRLTGREFFTFTPDVDSTVEIFDGLDYQSVLYPLQGPVQSVSTIEFWNYGTEAWEEYQDTLTPYTDGNRIFFREGGTFNKGIDNNRVTYKFGFNSFPEDLKQACMFTAKHMISGAASPGGELASQSTGEQSFSYFQSSNAKTTMFVPPKAMSTIRRYMRYHPHG